MLKAIFFVSLFCTLALASPRAKLIDELYRADPNRYSNDLWEDARLDVPELVQKYGYPCERHYATTTDGYIIGMHRIPYAPGNEGVTNKPVILLMHGLTSSSSDYIIMGHDLSLGYVLARAGYDVWMGNARGNYYSRNHVLFDPDQDRNEFWDFSWDEIGLYDLPAMIDYILATTAQRALHYVGHSQGTTAFFVMTSTLPHYNEKIRSMNALAPVAYMKDFQHPIMTPISPYADFILYAANRLGFQEMVPRSDLAAWAAYALCGDDSDGLENGCHLISGIALNPDLFNTTMMAVILGHTPAGASWKQPAHYAQNIVSHEFRRFNYGIAGNLERYKTRMPPTYNLTRITAPVALHYAPMDIFTPIVNVFRLREELPNVVMDNYIDDETFTHVNFIWALDKKHLHDKIFEVLSAF